MSLSDPKPIKVPQGALDLYDAYAHGELSRRGFFAGLSKFAVGGVTVSTLAACILPDYETKQQTASGDAELVEETLLYASPQGAGEMAGYLVRPAAAKQPLGGVVVIHENRGLNPYIRDVTRRAAKAGYVAFAPDALHPLGGYPGNDDEGRDMQATRGRAEMLFDFIAAAEVLRARDECSGKVGCVGFCFGGAIANLMAVRLPWLSAAVPFYGGWPGEDEAAQMKVPLQIHLAELDQRVNAGWTPYEAALKAAKAPYKMHMYAGVNHGFHNDTTPRFDPAAAQLAWQRTLDFFAQHLA